MEILASAKMPIRAGRASCESLRHLMRWHHNVSMSLYYDTARILSSAGSVGTLKSRVFNTKRPQAKSHPKQIYALASEAAQWSPVLADVIEKSRLLEHERKVYLLRPVVGCESVLTDSEMGCPTAVP